MNSQDYKIVLENLKNNRGRNSFGEQSTDASNVKPVRQFRTSVEGVLKKWPDDSAKRRPTQPHPGAMNKWEAEYATRLATLKAAGEVKWFGFESVKLRLAKATFYTPDFLVVPKEGPWELHEVKGHWRDDARVKFKVAIEAFPFVFVLVRKQDGRWISERF